MVQVGLALRRLVPEAIICGQQRDDVSKGTWIVSQYQELIQKWDRKSSHKIARLFGGMVPPDCRPKPSKCVQPRSCAEEFDPREGLRAARLGEIRSLPLSSAGDGS